MPSPPEARRLADVPDLNQTSGRHADAPGIAGEIAEILNGTTDLPSSSRRCRQLADALSPALAARPVMPARGEAAHLQTFP